MKQSKLLRRMSVAIVAVLLITMSVLSVTLAKYTKTFSESDFSITKSTWVIEAAVGSGEYSASETIDLGTATGKAHPGMDEQTYTIKVKNTGELDALVSVSLPQDSALPANMTVEAYNGVNEFTNSTALANTSGELTITIKINWPFVGTDTYSAGSVSIPVTVTVDQANPASNG